MNDQQARQTPIIDLLRDIPADARMVYEVTPTHHQSIPVGVLAKNAADEIERLRERVMDQEEKHADALREIDRLREWIACDIRCPCCQQIQTCSDDCTFSVDAPVEYERMEIARDFLAPVALLRSCRNERLA